MTITHLDREGALRAVAGRDTRFDGWFVTAVLTTGIYCRPSCPAMTPRAANVDFYPTAAAAQLAGFRACKRCRPDASPGSPEWDTRADVVARAMRLIADGIVDREGVPGLARALGYSVRQVERVMRAELGAGPLSIVRARRAQTARTLVESTSMPLADAAFAAGFSSVRAFNDTVRQVYATTPSDLRMRASATPRTDAAGTGASGSVTAGSLHVRLPFRRPFRPDDLFGHLVQTGVPGVEEWRGGAYRRTLRLPGGPGIVALRPQEGHVAAELRLTDVRDVGAAVARCRRLLDLDADPEAAEQTLGADPVLAPLVVAFPGRRMPRTPDGSEMALRVVLGQQVSTAAARTHAARLVSALGTPVHDPVGGLTHLFPAAEAVAGVDQETLSFPRTRRRTLVMLAEALAAGDLDLGVGADREHARSVLTSMPGIGPWTVDSIAMRALGDPDVFLAGDLGIRQVAAGLGLPTTPARLTAHAHSWRPWRSYAVLHLWGTLDHPITRMPKDGS